jgi:uracil-DNA glycosylase
LDPSTTLQEISRQVSDCIRCNLHYSRKNAVPGEGPSTATILFIGEGPGFHENEQGRPFVGQAGKLLEDLLGKIDLKRDPMPDELAACAEYLNHQIEALNPPVIVTLGRFSMAKFLPFARISDAHGKPVKVNGRLIVPMYHPAAALHQPSLKPTLEKDFLQLPELIHKGSEPLKETRVAEPKQNDTHLSNDLPSESSAEQLSLF